MHLFFQSGKDRGKLLAASFKRVAVENLVWFYRKMPNASFRFVLLTQKALTFSEIWLVANS
jgi:hypothetical protein